MCAARFLCGLEFLRGPLQCREVTPAEQGQQQLKLLPWPVPPPEPLQTVDGLRCEPLPDGLRRYAAYDGVGLHVPSHHRPGGHDGAVTDPHAGEDDGLIADPDIAADDNVPPVVPGLRDLRDRRVPRLVEDGKG